MTSARAEFLAGVRGQLPLIVGVVPFGAIYGALAVSFGLDPAAAQAMSTIVFAGSSQFIAASLFGAYAPMLVIVLTTLVVNLRHALYAASVAPYLVHLPLRWKLLLAYLLTDEAYVTTIQHYRQPGDSALRHWYFLGSGGTLWAMWQLSTAAGVFFGAQVPASWGLDFALPLTFIALLVPSLRDHPTLAAALNAGLTAVLAAALPYKLGLMLAAIVGIASGIAMGHLRARMHVAQEVQP